MNNWKSKETLQAFLEDSTNEAYLDHMFAETLEINLDGIWDAPYWYDKYYNQDTDYKVEYMRGYWEPLELGTIKEFDGDQYKYIDSISLPHEQEHQADDGSLCYEYRGSSFLRVWEPV